ncbi:receptor-type tyrosine-protein phosphatase beta-like isoform X4 [Haliotis rufescens]|uniref:receptor-type tyrosine-protein phosphatase beta-like isoform X4 n=1 Tax=Haliotis rufescens TaxID=6454 RepID=UPI00201EC4BC|nr:receptor-type tyrosine-protein phosphatase beta-like isoform X4 [Haliotis rufescens]
MKCLHLIFVYILLQVSRAELLANFNATVASTESTVTVRWDIVDPVNDTQYMLKHHRTGGIFITDLYFHSPFNHTHIEHTIANLYPGVNYTVYIFRNSNSSDGRIFIKSVNTVPLPPVSVASTSVGTTWVELTWDEGYNSTQESHQIVYTDQLNSGKSTVQGTGSTTFNLTGLHPGHRYDVSIKAVTGDKTSNESESVTITTVPSSPINLVVRAVNTTHLTASWENAPNSLQDGYRLSYMESEKMEELNATCPAAPPCVFAPGSLPGHLFRVLVFATRDNLTSTAISAERNTKPNPVSPLGGVAGVRRIEATWSAPVHSEVEYFEVSVVNTQTTAEQIFNKTLESGSDGMYTFSEDTLMGGVSYNVHVTSVTRTERSAARLKLFVTIPESPTALKGTAENTTALTISWTLPQHSHFENILIMLTKPTLEMVSITLDKEETRTTIVNLLPGSVYQVSVLVTTKAVRSNDITRTFRTKPDPPAYASLVVTETSATVTLAKTGDSNPDYFIVHVEGMTEQRNISVENPVAVLENLSAGEEYVVNSYAVTGNQDSRTVSRNFNTKPRPPTAVNVTAFNSTAIDVTWLPPEVGRHDNFTVILVQSDGASQVMTSQTTNFYYAFPILEAGQTYNVTVVTNLGMEQSSPVQQQVTTNPTSVATLQKIEANTTAIHVNWTSPVGQHFDFFHLVIDPQDGPMPNITRGIGDTTFWFVGLSPGQMYNISINTVKQRAGSIVWGMVTYILAVTEPEPVANLAVTPVDEESLSVKWDLSVPSQQNFFIVEYGAGDQQRSAEVTYITGQTSYELSLSQLLSGYTYNVTVKAVRAVPQLDVAYSAIRSQTATTAPKPVTSLQAVVNRTTISLQWEAQTGSKQDVFRVDFRPVFRNSATAFIEQNTTEPRLVLPGLFPGEMYQIRVYAISGNMISEMTTKTAVIAPLAPTDLSIMLELTTTSSVTLGWTYQQEETFVQTWSVSAYNDTFSLPAVNVTPGANSLVQYTVDSLKAGAKYQFHVMAVVEGKDSATKSVNTTVKPLLNIAWSESDQQTTNSSVVFTYSLPSSDDIFTGIRFSVNSTVPDIFRPKNNISVVKFSTLVAGTLYNVRAVSEISGMTSDPKFLPIRTRPNPVPVAHSSMSNEIKIQFGELNGNADAFVVMCDNGGTTCWNHNYSSQVHEVRVSNLQPYTNYNITVRTVAGDKSESQTFLIRTKEAAPSKVRNVNAVTTMSLTSVLVTWNEPQYTNGEVQHYVISYSGYDQSINGPKHNGSKEADSSSRRLELTGLRAGFFYTVSVRAFTVALGTPGQTTVQLGTAAPALKADFTQDTAKPRQASTEPGNVGETFVKVTFPNSFSDANGRIIQYTVIVSTDESINELTSPQLPSWKEAQQKASIKAYQTIGNCSDFFQVESTCGVAGRRKRAAETVTYKVFTVGSQTSCGNTDYCNGPLKPETTYYFKLRAYTIGGYKDTAYSQRITTAATPSNAGGIIGGVIAAILIIAIIAAVLIFLRRRIPKRAHKYNGDRIQFEQSSMHKFSRPVKLAEFKDHVRKMTADSDFRYAEEYEDLKEVGRDQPCMAAEFPANRPKNRFTNILPYDHSRVKLLPTDDDEGSDYINANYMPGFVSKREYIATQGPLPSTRDDLWRMLWEQNARNIVMLTKCMEKGREKSDHYWPNDSEPKFYGDLQVAILNETHLPDWTISEFKIQLGEQARQIRHFHYKAWPDFGVPKDPTSLLRFVRTVREKMFRDGGPIITHCSAGVGRSGTFIVLDHCLQHIKEKDIVDIYQIVYKLRKERVLMVQTEQQYKFIHECLLCVLEGREDEATYANVGHVNVAYEGHMSRSSLSTQLSIEDDEGINVEIP